MRLRISVRGVGSNKLRRIHETFGDYDRELQAEHKYAELIVSCKNLEKLYIKFY